jgi:hypothetical protein
VGEQLVFRSGVTCKMLFDAEKDLNINFSASIDTICKAINLEHHSKFQNCIENQQI